MKPVTGARVAGLALMIGAPMYVIAEVIKRHGNMASGGRSEMLETPALAHTMAQFSVLGLLATLAGLYAFWRSSDHERWEGFAVRFGLLCLTVGIGGFVLTNGLDHITLHVLTHDESSTLEAREAIADAVASTRAGIVTAAGSVNFLGALLLAVGLRSMLASAVQRGTATAMSLALPIGLAAHLSAEHLHLAWLEAIGGFSSVLVAIWFAVLGAGLFGERTRASQMTGAPATA